jgi:hypothetical protein
VARVVVCGYMIRHPVAGNVLAYFQYVLGLLRLGHDVVYLEESGWSSSCYDPITNTYGNEPEYGIAFLRGLMAALGVSFPICYVDRQSGTRGDFDWAEATRRLRQADVLLNVGGVCWLPEFRGCQRRVLIDMDPFFTQVGSIGVEGFEDHDAYFSYGVNIGREGCTVPTNGTSWVPTVPPVVPDLWSSARQSESLQDAGDVALTTVASWTAYGEVVYEGESYGQKDREFLRLLTLPSHVTQRLELAVGGAGPDTVEQLSAAGWVVRDAIDVSRDTSVYRQYITSSRGEFSAAKHAYVKTRSGWFSDRSVCYLAAGRPVVVQDSGFSDWLPVGRGVLPFSSLDEAVECIERLNGDYATHSQAAKEIADHTFDYAKVLPRLLDW